MNVFDFKQGGRPFLLSNPHSGTWIPPGIYSRLSHEGQLKRDTDWHLQRLYNFEDLDEVSQLVSNVSRYVIDVNRPPNNASLYPGQKTTGLCPVQTFRGKSLYENDVQPDENEFAERLESFWKPYHHQLSSELDRLVEKHGFAILFDAHSIADEIPRLFPGTLPTFSFGTNHGLSCSPSMQSLIDGFAKNVKDYSAVVNERFVGGFITREYGMRDNVFAVQLELAQSSYMDQDNLEWDDELASRVRPVIRNFIRSLLEWSPTI